MTAGRVVWAVRALACAGLLVATGCTTIGLARMRPLPMEFAYTETLRLCVARDVNVSPAQVRALVGA